MVAGIDGKGEGRVQDRVVADLSLVQCFNNVVKPINLFLDADAKRVVVRGVLAVGVVRFVARRLRGGPVIAQLWQPIRVIAAVGGHGFIGAGGPRVRGFAVRAGGLACPKAELVGVVWFASGVKRASSSSAKYG